MIYPAGGPGASNKKADTVWLGLGSNLGDRLANLRRAAYALALHPELEVRRGSRVFETDYVGPGRQDPYLNACLELGTQLEPLVLLAVLKGQEERSGREPGGHMQPRVIDLDILLWRGRSCRHERLRIPHPRAAERAFVLMPLGELAGAEIFPDSGETIAAACAKIRRKSAQGVHPARDEAGRDLYLLPGGGPTSEPTKEEWRAALAVHCR